MNNIDRIKKQLSMSTTLPAGSAGGGAPQYMMGSAQAHDHTHSHDGSCCGHDHGHDEECDEDTTNPSGGCC